MATFQIDPKIFLGRIPTSPREEMRRENTLSGQQSRKADMPVLSATPATQCPGENQD